MSWTRQGEHWVTCLRKSRLRGDPQGVIKSRVNNSTLSRKFTYNYFFFMTFRNRALSRPHHSDI